MFIRSRKDFTIMQMSESRKINAEELFNGNTK